VIFGQKIYDFLRSVKLALILLIAILFICLIGAVFLPPQVGLEFIFSSLWFNSLLILLVVNVGFCFFSRIWRRKITPVTLGLILFHLSFVLIFTGIVYNSFFYFYGAMRLSEGETLSNTVPESYDLADWGPFFDHSRLTGMTTFLKLHTHYKVNGSDKGVANEISIHQGNEQEQGFIYVTHHMNYNGLKYFRDRDGFSVLIVLYDKQGRELYGAYIPLQSLPLEEGRYLYTTGTATGPGNIPFPQGPVSPRFNLQVTYYPDPIQDRSGEVYFQMWSLGDEHSIQGDEVIATGKVALGEKLDAGDFALSMNEVRYWARMNIRYDPGLPVILTSLWIGLGGMILTTIARLIRKNRK
jgi:cytochrome c biogenesis protein ResB